LRDDGKQLVAAIARADLVVFAAPMRMGFVDPLLKRANDRMIPVLLPYIVIREGECRHPARYRPFDLALVVERGDSTTDELVATEQIYRRLAKNTAGKLAFFKVVEAGPTKDHANPDQVGKEQGHALGAD